MSIAEQLNEIGRLITVFESEAARFHPLTLKTLTFRRIETLKLQKLASPHHAVMLWQHYGEIGGKAEADRFQANLESSDLKWGLNGAELMQFAVLEGEHIGLFVRMAERGGSLFDANEASLLKMRVLTELQRSRTKDSTKKFVGVVNDAPLAIWLNFLLFHLSLVSPGRERVKLIHPDPFSLSLLALERLREVGALTKSDRTDTRIDDITFDVALSFAGEQRVYVAEVAGVLRSKLGPNKVFYDFDYQAQLARPNLDVLLQGIYRRRATLVVAFLSRDFASKQWSGLEMRAIRELIKHQGDDKVMFVRLDDADVPGIFSIDGHLDAASLPSSATARFILQRLRARPRLAGRQP